MKYLILLLTTALLLGAATKQFKKRSSYIPFQVKSTHYTKDTYGLYKGFISGNKLSLSKKLKTVMKRYGLSHILTPSGIHLSSLLIIFKFIPFLEAFILIGLFIYVREFGSYYSIERMILFRFIYKIPKLNLSLEYSYICTLYLSILIGHFQQSPLSFIYSMLFWGTIIIFRDNPFKVVIFLNLSLLCVSSITDQAVSPLSLIVNPFFTFIFTLLFPISLVTSTLPNIDFLHQLHHFLLNIYVESLYFFDGINFTPDIIFPATSVVLCIFFFQLKQIRIAVIVLLLSIWDLSPSQPYSESKKIINIGHQEEIIRLKKNRIFFIDQTCSIKEFHINCKKKPSAWGGFRI